MRDRPGLTLRTRSQGHGTVCLRSDFCAVMAATEKAADTVAGDVSQCVGDGMNVEGAVAVPDSRTARHASGSACGRRSSTIGPCSCALHPRVRL